ncbi:hypothetical protein FE257_012247 [Aspergillus nanangensis]|uniref:Heterokaryon incompatibility domain-containing protein n=1 Tax=Aspergillus nanangensis TaxID=2582783 RepID=A0AAD4GQ25_ASPNN|nr:hypothetical protein FE257_012247 [Aspergillus nanangensis]
MAHLDTDQAFGDIFLSDNLFRAQLLEIAQCQESRDVARQWADRLRFLTSPVPAEYEEGIDDDGDAEEEEEDDNDNTSTSPIDSGRGSMSDDDLCSCSAMPLSTDHDKTTTLVLTDPDTFPNCIHYVAVSYCWQSAEPVPSHTPQPEITNYTTIQTPSGPRPPIAPPGVLHRAMRFAAHYDEPFVWIDQECIEQASPADKEHGIQAMDLVYQRSVRPVGLLACSITTQTQMDMLIALIEGIDIPLTQMDVLLETLSLVAHDPWFTRAWILQESVVGGLAMTLLIQHDPSLTKPVTLGDLRGEVEIDLLALINGFEWASTCVDRVEPDIVDRDMVGRLRGAMHKIASAQPGHVPPSWTAIDDGGDPEYRQTCNAAQALAFLELRQNERIPDRLAILANLCDFPVRVNTLVVEERGYGLSICAFVLALLNGDLSLVGAYQRGGKREESLGFSWGPPRDWKICSIDWEDDSYLYRLVEPEILLGGLALSGWVWCVDRPLDMRDMRDKYRDVASRVDVEADAAVLRVLVLEVMDTLVKRLRDLGLVSLARLIDQADRSKTKASRHDDGLCFEEKVAFLRQSLMERAGGNVKVADSYNLQWKLDFDLSTRRTVLFDAVCQHGQVLLGRLVGDPSDVHHAVLEDGDGHHDSYGALFDPSVQMDELVLVPCLQRGADIPRSTGQDREFTPICWKVTVNTECEDEDQSAFAVQGHQTVQGMWVIDEDADPGRYLLA